MATPTLVRDKIAAYVWVDDGGAPSNPIYATTTTVTTVGNKIVVWGIGGTLTGVTDARGNVYTVHRSGAGGEIWLATALCTTALQVGDTIWAMRSTQTVGGLVASEWSGLGAFGNAAPATFNTTSMVGGATSATSDNDLVLGLFSVDTPMAQATHCEIATPGSGFTNMSGVFRNGVAGGYDGASLDSEYRVVNAGAITATATGGIGSAGTGRGLTATFKSAGVARTYADAILDTPGLLSYWRLGEASGNALDSKGTNHGTAAGGVTRAVTGLVGDDNKAVRGDGVAGTRISVPDTAGLNVGSQMTVEAWIKLESYSTATTIANRTHDDGGASANFWRLDASTGGSLGLQFWVRGSFNDSWVTVSNVAKVGQRQHVVGVHDHAAGTIKLYVNGALVGTDSTYSNPPNLGPLLLLTGLVGTLDEVSYYNKPLTAQQVLDHYMAGMTDSPVGALGLSGSCVDSLTAPPIFVKDLGSYGHNSTTPTPNPCFIGVTGPVPVGNTVIIFGSTEGSPITAVTDTRGNTYKIRSAGDAGVYPDNIPALVDATVTTPLQAGDQITITRMHTSPVTLVAAEFAGMHRVQGFESLASATFSGTAATGGARTNLSPRGLVLGLFKINASTTNQIATPGSGYTNLTGLVGLSGPDGSTDAVDWEYKRGGVPSPVTATATLAASAAGSGLTAVYRDPTAPIIFTDACSGTIGLSGSVEESYLSGWRGLVRELPPLRHHVDAISPDGRHYRWGTDEPRAENIFNGLRWSSTMPGGHESMDCVLPRKPGVDYSDLERLTTLRVIGAGANVVGEFRLERTPQTSGDQMSISPSAVGWQAHLDDNKGVSIIFIDRALGGWGGPSRQRTLNMLASQLNPLGGGTVTPDTTTGIPALDLGFDDPGSWLAANKPMVEPWYDAGPGNSIGRMRGSWAINGSTSAADGNWTLGWFLSNLDTYGGGTDSTGDIFTGAQGSSGVFDLLATGRRRFALMQFYYTLGGGTPGSNNRYGCMVSYVRVFGDHNLAIRGLTPQTEGLICSDVVRHAVTRWAPMLRIGEDSFQETSFIIPQLAFRDNTTVSEIIRQSTRFGLEDWAVWDNRTFYLSPRNANPLAKRWRARVGPARLEQTGQQMDRLWESILVQYTDVDGTTRVVGPPGSNADVEDARLKDSDPSNPANVLGITRRDKLMMGTSTSAAAIEVGRRFLEEQKLIDRSGRASFIGHVTDDHGVVYPFSEIRAGDAVSFVDAADTSYRRIVKVNHDERGKTASVDLDAPPEGLQAVLERLGVVLAPLGL